MNSCVGPFVARGIFCSQESESTLNCYQSRTIRATVSMTFVYVSMAFTFEKIFFFFISYDRVYHLSNNFSINVKKNQKFGYIWN